MDFKDLMRVAFEFVDDPRYWADELDVSVPSVKRWAAGAAQPLPLIRVHVASKLRGKFSSLLHKANLKYGSDVVAAQLGIDPGTIASYIVGNELPECEVVINVIHGVRDLAE